MNKVERSCQFRFFMTVRKRDDRRSREWREKISRRSFDNAEESTAEPTSRSNWSSIGLVECKAASVGGSEISSWFQEGKAVYFCDGAFSSDRNRAAAGWVLLGSKGKLIDGNGRSCEVVSPKWSETRAVLDACLAASKEGYNDVRILSDAASVVNLCNSKKAPPWEIEQMVQQIRQLGSAYGIFFGLISRNLNCIPDWVVKQVCRDNLPVNWLSSPRIVFCVL